jgi:hypothetical protein
MTITKESQTLKTSLNAVQACITALDNARKDCDAGLISVEQLIQLVQKSGPNIALELKLGLADYTSALAASYLNIAAMEYYSIGFNRDLKKVIVVKSVYPEEYANTPKYLDTNNEYINLRLDQVKEKLEQYGIEFFRTQFSDYAQKFLESV